MFDSNEARAFSLALQTQSFEPIKAYKVNEMVKLFIKSKTSKTNRPFINSMKFLQIFQQVNYYYELEEIAK